MQHLLFACPIILLCLQPCDAHESVPDDCAAMTAARLGELIQRIDPKAELIGLESYLVAVIYDESADRMRILIPIKST